MNKGLTISFETPESINRDAFRAGQQDILRRLREICSGDLEWIEDRIALRRREYWEATPALDDISDIDTARVAITAAADAIEKEVAGE